MHSFFYIFLTVLQVSANPEPEGALLNQNDEKRETPTLGENLGSDGANDSSKGEAQTNYQTIVPISNLEVPTDDKKSDAPNGKTEFLEPAPTACFSNQGTKTRSCRCKIFMCLH